MLKMEVKSSKNNESVNLTTSGEGTVENEFIPNDVEKVLLRKIESNQPNVITFTNGNLQSRIVKALYDKGIYFNEKDNTLKYGSGMTYTELEKEVESSTSFELIINEDDSWSLTEALLNNNYIISTKKSNGKVKVLIHGTN